MHNCEMFMHFICCHKGKGKGEVTHFKSVVDAREARLGCGISIKPGDGTYVVAHYSLGPGNHFKLNDFIPSNDIGMRKQPGNTQVIFINYLSI